MSNKQNPVTSEEALDAFIKEQLELLADELDVNAFMTTIHAEASKTSVLNSHEATTGRDGRPHWVHFS